MKPNGFTLIEVVVVVAIIAIVLAIGVLNFNVFKGKADTEKQTRELHSDISDARLNAMQNKQRSAFAFGSSHYIFKTYSSDNDTAGSEKGTVRYKLEVRKKTGSGTLEPLNSAVDRIEFDSRGYTGNQITLVVLPVTYSGGLDCIEVQKARTSIGRMENVSTCRKQ